MTLYEIDAAIESCVDAETGEIIDIQKLESLEMAREQKIENIACWIKDLKAEAKALKAEKQNIEKRQKADENKAEQLENYLIHILDGAKFKTTKCSVSYRKSVSTAVDMEELLKYSGKDVYLKKQEPEPNKTVIKEALEQGINVPGCSLVENNSIQIK